jgi:hypothetical protein
MLSTKENSAEVPTQPATSWDEVLKFASENQRLEGFPGEITDAVRQHRPNLEELQAVARRFGAQVPQGLPPVKE